ncbi:MAG TPA: VWA domain-containing protein [Anaerolineaceae bacterium]|nr:VWA domain-containing protein [Anaerolineaceae bacterium]
MSEERLTGSLLQSLLLFGRILLGLGLNVDTRQMIDTVEAMQFIGIRKREGFYYSLRGLFVHRREDLAIFDKAFQAFWAMTSNGRCGLRVRSGGSLRRSRPAFIPADLLTLNNGNQRQPDSQSENEPPLVQATFTYSDREALRRKDFTRMGKEELEAIKRLLSEFTWQFQRPSRRFRPGNLGQYDLRRTYRKNLRFGGEMLEWAYREPKIRPRPMVILADISGSMERYTRVLLYFAHSIGRKIKRNGETFVFSTRLTRITRLISGDHPRGTGSPARSDWPGTGRYDPRRDRPGDHG